MIEHLFMFPTVQKLYKIRPRNTRIIVENNETRFYGPRCRIAVVSVTYDN